MPSYTYDYPRPAMTVDALLFSAADDGLRVLLIKRKHDPFAGHWAIPGGFLDMDETAAQAAQRELAEETGIKTPRGFCFLGLFDAPDRDPRGRVISVAHLGLVTAPAPAPRGADDATEAAWIRPADAHPLAFDHQAILAAGLARLRDHALQPGGILDILPPCFDQELIIQALQDVGTPPDEAQSVTAQLLSGPRVRRLPGATPSYELALP